MIGSGRGAVAPLIPPPSAPDPDLIPEHEHGLGQVLVRGGLSRSRNGSWDLDFFMRKEEDVWKDYLIALARARRRSR